MTVCDVSILKSGDSVYYYNRDNGEFIIDKGIIKEDNIYSDGVEVHGDEWKQYVSKWFICKVERNGGSVIRELKIYHFE